MPRHRDWASRVEIVASDSYRGRLGLYAVPFTIKCETRETSRSGTINWTCSSRSSSIHCACCGMRKLDERALGGKGHGAKAVSHYGLRPLSSAVTHCMSNHVTLRFNAEDLTTLTGGCR